VVVLWVAKSVVLPGLRGTAVLFKTGVFFALVYEGDSLDVWVDLRLLFVACSFLNKVRNKLIFDFFLLLCVNNTDGGESSRSMFD
jgi:hypothetical protein